MKMLPAILCRRKQMRYAKALGHFFNVVIQIDLYGHIPRVALWPDTLVVRFPNRRAVPFEERPGRDLDHFPAIASLPVHHSEAEIPVIFIPCRTLLRVRAVGMLVERTPPARAFFELIPAGPRRGAACEFPETMFARCEHIPPATHIQNGGHFA